MKKKIILTLLATMALNPLQAVMADEAVFSDVIDFENFEEGAELSETQSYNLGVLKFELGAGENSLKVVTDEKMGSKALEITKGVKKGDINVRYLFDKEIASGIYDIYMDMRVEHAEACVNKFGTLNAEDSIGATRANAELNEYGFMVSKPGDFTDLKDREKYTYHYGIDADSRTIDLEIIKGGSVVKTFEKMGTFSGAGIRSINLNITDPGTGGFEHGWDYDRTTNQVHSPTVVYLDNLIIKKKGLSVEGASPSDNSENVEIDKKINVVFSDEVDDTDLDNDISIAENGTVLSKDKYELKLNGKFLMIEFPDEMEYNSGYTVEIKKGLKAKNSGYMPLAQSYTFSFSTKRMFDEIDGLKDGERYESFSVTLPQLENIDIKAMLTNPNGEETEYVSGTIITEPGSYTLSVTGENKRNGKPRPMFIILRL